MSINFGENILMVAIKSEICCTVKRKIFDEIITDT